MLHVFGDILQRLYTAREKLIDIDNCVCKLHYQFTFWLLLACTTLVCSRQYFGQHIQCVLDGGLSPHFVQTYCFFTSTYSVHNEYSSSHTAHVGVGPHTANENKVYHSYYQWVPFVLFGQAILFYLPHLVWKNYEAGTLSLMAHGLQKLYLHSPDEHDRQVNGHHILSGRTMIGAVENLAKQFQAISRYRLNRFWAFMMVLHECLNLINVIFQLYLLDAFLGGNFLSLGPRILAADPSDNPFEQVFPKVTKCDFQKFGASGSIQVHDVMCIMALNIINEKIYTILWFWLAVLAPVSAVALGWRMVSYILYSRSEWFNIYVLKENTGIRFHTWEVGILMRSHCYSDWLMLTYLSSNMDGPIFAVFLRNLNAAHIEYLRRRVGSKSHGWQNLGVPAEEPQEDEGEKVNVPDTVFVGVEDESESKV